MLHARIPFETMHISTKIGSNFAIWSANLLLSITLQTTLARDSVNVSRNGHTLKEWL